MRKSVKLAAASALAAVAMIGGSATAASAHESVGSDPINTCDNSTSQLATAKDNGQSESDATQIGHSTKSICQSGPKNYADNHHDGFVAGGDATLTSVITKVSTLTAVITG
jgi:hypothetical protein